MYIDEVKTAKQEKIFINVHVLFNKNSTHWIRPLDQEIKNVFNPGKNSSFRYGKAIRWILFDDHKQPCGRIAAFVNRYYKNKGDEFPVGGVGFFDCEDKQSSANLLFDTARKWLEKENMKAMDGPINFGERNTWWGLLVEGFHEPVYGMNYNPPYYKKLFETYGFKNFYNQICWSMPVSTKKNQLSKRFYSAHKKFAENPDFKAVRIKKNDADKFAKDFSTVYNLAWAQHEGNKQLTFKQAYKLFISIKPILDSDLLWFAYYRDKPVAMWISIPDINPAIRNLNGKMNFVSKIKLMINKLNGVINRFVGIIYGIIPEFQGTGIDYYLIVEAEKVFKKKRKYVETELQWQGDFNPKMQNISKNLDAVQSRVLVTYRYLFNQDISFKRHPILD